MSGVCFNAYCPNCGKEASASNDSKPFENTSMECPHCGFYSYTKTGYYNLAELNEIREEHDLNELSELPERTFEVDIDVKEVAELAQHRLELHSLALTSRMNLLDNIHKQLSSETFVLSDILNRIEMEKMYRPAMDTLR